MNSSTPAPFSFGKTNKNRKYLMHFENYLTQASLDGFSTKQKQKHKAVCLYLQFPKKEKDKVETLP